jgi:hypothetical protein
VKLYDPTRRIQRAKTEADGPEVFSDHVRALASGEALDDRSFEALWRALGAALRRELKRRGLWESAPAFLGVYGGESWQGTPGGPSGIGAQSPLEELLAECYVYIFVDRLRSLQAQLLVKPNVEGLVTLNIRHFLHERQRSHDPIGYQIFEVVRAAVLAAIEKGELRVLSDDRDDKAIRNDTVLGFPRELTGPGSRSGTLASRVARWNDELLPDLVTARGRRQEEVVERLGARLPDLQRWGFLSFRFKDLVDPLKADVRARWAAILDLEQGEASPQHESGDARGAVRTVPPDTGIEEYQRFRKLIDCVLKRLERLETSGRTREYLAVLWQFLRVQACGGAGGAPASRLDLALAVELAAEGAEDEEDEEDLSLRSLAEKLHIPRERLPGLYRTLGELVTGCRAAISGKAAVIPLVERSGHAKSAQKRSA